MQSVPGNAKVAGLMLTFDCSPVAFLDSGKGLVCNAKDLLFDALGRIDLGIGRAGHRVIAGAGMEATLRWQVARWLGASWQ